MLLYSSFAVVFISVVAVPWVTDATGEQCQNAAALKNELTCAFTLANGTCGWIVYNSSSNPLWKIDADNKFTVEIPDKFDRTVQLRSPIICATNIGFSTLQFTYNIQNNYCEQSVFLEVGSCNTTLWSTNQSTNTYVVVSPNITIDNQILNFHIVLQSRNLGAGYCQYKLDNINFKYFGQRNGSSLTWTEDGASPGCRLPGEGTSGGGLPGDDSSSGGLSGGGIAGIIVSLVVVIAVVVIVFFLLQRRKTGGKLPFQKLFGRLRTVIQTSSGSATDVQAAERTNRTTHESGPGTLQVETNSADDPNHLFRPAAGNGRVCGLPIRPTDITADNNYLTFLPDPPSGTTDNNEYLTPTSDTLGVTGNNNHLIPTPELLSKVEYIESSPQHVSELDVVKDTNGQNIGSSETPHGASGAGSPTNIRGECPYEDIRETGGTYYSALDHRGNTDGTYSSLQNSYENATVKARENEEGSYTQLQRPSPQTEL